MKRTVVITGGSGGLGYRTARALAAAGQDWTVVLAGRNERRTAEAADALRSRTGADVAGVPLDLASLASVRRFPQTLAERDLPPLHALVCNAGLQVVSGLSLTEDGYETTFAVNHLAHFLLANLLLPQLTAPGRIVFVASDTHDPARRTGMPAPRLTDAGTLARPADGGNEVDGDEDPSMAGRRRYATSKLCNVLTAYELARQVGPGVTVNAFDPGLMPGSGLARDYTGVQRLAWRFLMPALTVLPINAHTPRHSGRALARLVTDPALAGTTGRYFQGRREVRSSAESYDAAKAGALWQGSADLVDLVVPS